MCNSKIEGVSEIRNAIFEWQSYRQAFNRYLEEECPICIPKKPISDIDALKKKYPRAAAYLYADNWSNSSNYTKASYGRTAKESILNGEDYNVAITKMQNDWSKYVESHMWD